MKTSNRREFLRVLAQISGAATIEHGYAGGLSALLLGAQRALAAPQADPKGRFVLIRIHGAMDSTLGLHPYLGSTSGLAEQDLFLGYKEQPLANIAGTSISLGPAAAPVAQFAPQMAIVRGLYMGPNDLGHPFAMQHITSGRTQESAPSWTSYLGSEYARTGSYVVTNAPLLRGTIKAFPTLLTSVLREQLAPAARATGPSILSVYKGNASLGVNHYLTLMDQKDKLAKFLEACDASKPFDQQAYDVAITNGKSDADAKALAQQNAVMSDEDLAVASLYSGISRAAQIDFTLDDGGSIDTHQSHAQNHLDNQKKRWVRIQNFLSSLRKFGLLDDTLVAVVTEFNRTPGLNANGGKDHNYSDSAMALFGRGVNGGSVFGDRRLYKRADGFPYAYWAGEFMDFTTGKMVDVPKGTTAPEGVSLVRPPDVWASVINSLNPDLVKELPAEAKVIPGLFQRA